MKKITVKSFSEFLAESDGFGTSPFLMRKEKDMTNYFFILEDDEKNQRGFRLCIGKYSDHEPIPGSKNSYCVLNMNEMSPELIQDIAVEKTEIPQLNSEEFEVSEDQLVRLFKLVSQCVLDYLEFNPKIVKMYDEIQDNLVYKGEGKYLEFMNSIFKSYVGEDWSMQEGSHKNQIFVNR